MPHFNDIKPFVRDANYKVHSEWKYLELGLDRYKERVDSKGHLLLDGLDLDPDFQRGHVWTPEQQIAYVEYALQGGSSGRDIYFNNPTWQGTYTEKTVLVDGKQRLAAVLAFLHGEIPAFGHKFPEWEGRLPSNAYFVFHMNTLKTRREVLEWYLVFNAGGTPHTEEELNRVRELLKLEKYV